jgi:predicted enzyme related to lactoylglutathione lyase
MSAIVHFEVTGDNLDELQKFYQGVFNWQMRDSGMPGMDYRLISNGGGPEDGIGGMYARSGDQGLNQILVYFGVDSVDETLEKIKSGGGSVMQEKMQIPGVGYMAVVTDPAGNMFALFEGEGDHSA